MVRENQRICHNHIFTPASVENNNLGNIIGSERLTAPIPYQPRVTDGGPHGLRIDSICLGFVAIESHYRKFRFDLTRINLHDADSSGNQFFSQGIRERSHCGLGGAVYRSARIAFSAGNTTYVYYISPAAIISFLENR